jgi:hypothetical protein
VKADVRRLVESRLLCRHPLCPESRRGNSGTNSRRYTA